MLVGTCTKQKIIFYKFKCNEIIAIFESAFINPLNGIAFCFGVINFVFK